MNRFLEIVRHLPPRGRCGGTIALMCAVMIADQERDEANFDPLASLHEAGFTLAEITEFAADAWVIVGDVRELIAGAADRPRAA